MPAFSRFALSGALAVAVTQVAAIRRADIQDVLVSAAGSEAQLVTLASNSASDEWNVYDSRGPKFTDIAQGELGDCYYLAGIAAIAQRHPEVIKKAFATTGELNKLGRTIFKLRFLLDGEEKIVAVDDMVPMRSSYYSHPFIFAAFNDGDNAWPSLLEKGFAKLQGSYLAIRGGIEYEAFKAITQAPVDVVDIRKSTSPATIFEWITESMDNNWPMTAGSVDNEYNIAAGHAFVLMEAGVSDGTLGVKGTQMVRVYNPWSENQYGGALAKQQTTTKGDYWMPLSEFMASFDGVQRARIVANAHLSSKRVEVGAGALTFSTKSNKPFTVQLEYPSKRMMPESCQQPFRRSMNVGLRVAPASNPTQGQQGVAPWRHSLVSNLRADMPGGAGEYLVYAMADFENMAAVDHVIVNIYSEEAIDDLQISSMSPGQVVDKMYGTCDELSWTKGGKRFKRSQKTFKGSVLWEGVGCNDIVYLRDSGLWLAPSKSQSNHQYTNFQVSDLQCTGSSPSPAPGPSPSPGYGPMPSPYRYPTPSPYPSPSPSYGPTPSPYPSPSPSYGPTPSPYPSPSPSYRPTPSPYPSPSYPSPYPSPSYPSPYPSPSYPSPYPSPSYGPTPSPYPSPSPASGSADIHMFDKCMSLKWKSWSFSRVTGTNTWRYETYPGQPLFEIRVVESEWRVVSPGDSSSTRYFAKGTSEIECVGSSLAEEAEEAEVDPSFLEIVEAEEEELTRVKGHQRKENASGVCTTEALKKALDRYRNLDNFEELKTSEDSLFPPRIQSIGDKDADCGDSATGEAAMCDKLDQWGSITKRFGGPDYTPKAFS